MDGHTTHINVAIGEFCRNNDIILYCLPAHASHILQPLDVSVYGPLKLFWNKALNNFKLKYNLAMNKSHFFTVFTESWETATNRPESVVSGFRKSGLFPFNPHAVDFSRLIDEENAALEFERARKVSFDQRIGHKAAFHLVKETLSLETLEMFDRRFEELYDIVNDSHENQLYRVYKNVITLADSGVSSTNQADSIIASTVFESLRLDQSATIEIQSDAVNHHSQIAEESAMTINI